MVGHSVHVLHVAVQWKCALAVFFVKTTEATSSEQRKSSSRHDRNENLLMINYIHDNLDSQNDMQSLMQHTSALFKLECLIHCITKFNILNREILEKRIGVSSNCALREMSLHWVLELRTIWQNEPKSCGEQPTRSNWRCEVRTSDPTHVSRSGRF